LPAIREAGQAVVAHDDEFDPNARDVDWLRGADAFGSGAFFHSARIIGPF